MLNKIQINKALQKLKELLIDRFGQDTEIYLFGSVARGEFEPLSDIDIMVLLNRDVNNELEEEVFEMAYPIELECNVVFGIVIYSKKFWYSPLTEAMPLKKSIDNEGVLV